jgi:hypothetical protein
MLGRCYSNKLKKVLIKISVKFLGDRISALTASQPCKLGSMIEALGRRSQEHNAFQREQYIHNAAKAASGFLMKASRRWLNLGANPRRRRIYMRLNMPNRERSRVLSQGPRSVVCPFSRQPSGCASLQLHTKCHWCFEESHKWRSSILGPRLID